MKLLRANISIKMTDKSILSVTEKEDSMCMRVYLMYACVREGAEGPVWKKPMQSCASFRLCHAQTSGRLDTKDAVSVFGSDSKSMQFIWHQS